MGAEARNNLFSKGRDEGLEVALRIVQGGGTAKDIEKEIRFREKTGISMGLSNEELNKACERIKELTCGTMKIAMAAAIADSYGFGTKRIQRALDNFDKLTEYLANGWTYWIDVVDELKARYHLDLSIEDGRETLRHYSRPESADLWEECDLVAKEPWEAILKQAGYTQGVSNAGYPCVFDGKIPLIEYRDKYEQVEAYAMIQGVLLERSKKDGYGIPKPAPSEAPKQVPKQQGKKRRRKR